MSDGGTIKEESERMNVTCLGVRKDMTRCASPATKTVRVEGISKDETYPACDDCAALVDGCDGVSIEPLNVGGDRV